MSSVRGLKLAPFATPVSDVNLSKSSSKTQRKGYGWSLTQLNAINTRSLQSPPSPQFTDVFPFDSILPSSLLLGHSRWRFEPAAGFEVRYPRIPWCPIYRRGRTGQLPSTPGLSSGRMSSQLSTLTEKGRGSVNSCPARHDRRLLSIPRRFLPIQRRERTGKLPSTPGLPNIPKSI